MAYTLGLTRSNSLCGTQTLFFSVRNVLPQTNTNHQTEMLGKRAEKLNIFLKLQIHTFWKNSVTFLRKSTIYTLIMPQKEKAIMKDFYVLLSCKYRKNRNCQSAKSICTQWRGAPIRWRTYITHFSWYLIEIRLSSSTIKEKIILWKIHWDWVIDS